MENVEIITLTQTLEKTTHLQRRGQLLSKALPGPSRSPSPSHPLEVVCNVYARSLAARVLTWRHRALAARVAGVAGPDSPLASMLSQPQSLDDMVDFMVQRTLDLFGYDLAPLRRWQGAVEGAQKLS